MPSRLREISSAAKSQIGDSGATRQSSRNTTRRSYVMETDSDDFEDTGEMGNDMDTKDQIPDGEEDQMSAMDLENSEIADEDADDGVPLGATTPQSTQVLTLKLKGPVPPLSRPSTRPGDSAAEIFTTTSKTPTTRGEIDDEDDDDDDDDEELSELGSDDEQDDENNDDENEDINAQSEDEIDDIDPEGAEISYDEDEQGSRESTPGVNKMTKRQRARIDQVDDGNFLQLPMEPQIKKHLTVEEHAMRRAEMARRRKNLSEKRNEEEKADTINRLLKKQAPKRRGKISFAEIAAQDRDDDEQEAGQTEVEEIVSPANPVMIRWISSSNGCQIGVPREWEGTPGGRLFWTTKSDKGQNTEPVNPTQGVSV